MREQGRVTRVGFVGPQVMCLNYALGFGWCGGAAVGPRATQVAGAVTPVTGGFL